MPVKKRKYMRDFNDYSPSKFLGSRKDFEEQEFHDLFLIGINPTFVTPTAIRIMPIRLKPI
ncbi:MAG: hypothetical protein QG610_494 [Euryarchaeota archaeon]|nr:hypothetical protein [Euryarchaeota archaeon]